MEFNEKLLELRKRKGLTQEELAFKLGKTQSSVANKLRLLSLPDEVQDSLLKEQVSERHARALLNIPDSTKQIEMLQKIILFFWMRGMAVKTVAQSE